MRRILSICEKHGQKFRSRTRILSICEKHGQKFRSRTCKLFETHQNLEIELLKGHSLLFEYFENNIRTTKLIIMFTNVKLCWKNNSNSCKQPALQGTMDLCNKLSLRHPHACTKQTVRKH